MGQAVMGRNLPKWERSGAGPAAEFAPPPGSSDPLVDFLVWYGRHGPAFPMVPHAAIDRVGQIPGVTLFRSGAFQVQLFILPPGAVPLHRHPHVDTIEMHLAGHYDFRVGGVSAIPMQHLHDRRGRVSRWWWRGVRVRPDTWHDLVVHDAGAAFLSVQHWLGTAPASVGDDWEGAPVDPAHEASLRERAGRDA